MSKQSQIQMKLREIKIVRDCGGNKWKMKMSNINKDRIKKNANHKVKKRKNHLMHEKTIENYAELQRNKLISTN